MQERKGVITFKGQPLTLLGPEMKAGEMAPDFIVLDKDLQELGLKDFKGKICLISVVPSLDTPVCEMQTRRFNQEAAGLPEKVAVLTISMDLPFAQQRFCSVAGIERVSVLSDHRQASFGAAYGILIKELRLLGRGIFIVDDQNRIRYVEYVKEISHHPDYDTALAAVKKLY
jgi:thiol peroxidase